MKKLLPLIIFSFFLSACSNKETKLHNQITRIESQNKRLSAQVSKLKSRLLLIDLKKAYTNKWYISVRMIYGKMEKLNDESEEIKEAKPFYDSVMAVVNERKRTAQKTAKTAHADEDAAHTDESEDIYYSSQSNTDESDGIYYSSQSSTEGSNVTDNPDVFKSAWDGSVYQVKRFLKKHYLKDPDSYESIGWSNIFKAPPGSNYTYSVRNKYRAKNGFGGYVVKDQIFYLNSNGNVIRVKDVY